MADGTVKRYIRHRVFVYSCARTLLSLVLLSLLAACSELEKPKTEPFFSETVPPRVQEFRWSNGKMPKSLDPALASAPPETDIVRAVFEGLTDTDPKTLKEIPGVAEKWSASEDLRTWTFSLRKGAKWSNGEPVTAQDFVASWRRLASMGEKGPHRNLLNNIVGMRSAKPVSPEEMPDFLSNQRRDPPLPLVSPDNANSSVNIPGNQPNESNAANTVANQAQKTEAPEEPFGAVAIDEYTLQVSLVKPDKQFPRLVANPIFLPVFGDGAELQGDELNKDIVTNGAFRIASIGPEGIQIERSEEYWNRPEVKLERVQFVPKDNAEKALQAYRAGEIDAITNAEFEPLALKLLTPYEDFRRTTHNALNFYQFNLEKAPFSDRRVREALAIAIERERLTEGEMKGSTQPAFSFLPFVDRYDAKLTQNSQRARELLDKAGFPGGENFPVIKLVINRNDTQQRIARSVARMWEQNLNLETEIIVKEAEELEAVRASGEFDLIRRGVVLPTTNETANLMAIVGPNIDDAEEVLPPGEPNRQNAAPEGRNHETTAGKVPPASDSRPLFLTEEEAIYELHSIPLYFPTSYSLVKPYVLGFDINGLDAPSLKDVVIDNTWQPK